MKIKKAHILARHVYNMEDDSAGIFYTAEGGGMDWLWEDTRFVRQQQPRISEVRRTNLQRSTEKSPTGDVHGISSGAV